MLFTLYGNRPVHQLDDAPGDGHTQTGAPVAVCAGRILLAEGIEQPGKKLLAHPDPCIANDKAQRGFSVESRNRFHNKGDGPAGRCKLDCIPKDVEHNLAQLHVIADIIIVDRTFHTAFVLNALVPALPADHRIDLAQCFREGKLFILHGHAAGFNAAHVKNVIDNAEQVLG